MDDISMFGEEVLVVRTLFNGETEREWLPAFWAVEDVLYSERNGVDVQSARILWYFDDVLDNWGQSP